MCSASPRPIRSTTPGTRDSLATVREFVDGLDNLQTIGRNGLHRYNNQDHAMLTGLLAVRNLMQGERNDLWSVNTDQEYHEEVADLPDREMAELEAGLGSIFNKVDGVALGSAVGALTGVLLCLVTLLLVLRGGDDVGPRLGLLAQYFPGYTVTGPGSLLGLAYGSASGFAVGWGFSVLRNAALFLYMATLQRRAQLHLLRRFLEFI